MITQIPDDPIQEPGLYERVLYRSPIDGGLRVYRDSRCDSCRYRSPRVYYSWASQKWRYLCWECVERVAEVVRRYLLQKEQDLLDEAFNPD